MVVRVAGGEDEMSVVVEWKTGGGESGGEGGEGGEWWFTRVEWRQCWCSVSGGRGTLAVRPVTQTTSTALISPFDMSQLTRRLGDTRGHKPPTPSQGCCLCYLAREPLLMVHMVPLT